MKITVVDRRGRTVKVGTKVRVLEIAASVKRDLPADEVADLTTMVGAVFEVYEIDEHGAAWVEKVSDHPDEMRSHSLALEAHEMEIA